MTAKAAARIRSRPGIASGNDRAIARVTTPRIPAQLITVEGPSQRDWRRPLMRSNIARRPSDVNTQAKRDRTLAVVERLSRQPDGSQKHPRLLEQYGYRARLTERYSGEAGARAVARKEHFEVVLAAIAAGRAEIVRLHRSGMIHDEVLRTLESDLDLQELAARAVVNEAMS